MADDSNWGVSHLSDLPITTTYGVIILAVLIVLVLLRLFFADITIRSGVK
jgi:hypothetical protein